MVDSQESSDLGSVTCEHEGYVLLEDAELCNGKLLDASLIFLFFSFILFICLFKRFDLR